MKINNIFEEFNHGLLIKQFNKTELKDLSWNPHPKFHGVELKHIVTGSDTEGQISCHLVKIEPNCKISLHTHENNLEIHEVIKGEGQCILGTESQTYHSGIVSIIPKNIEHEVIAGDEGLYLFAKFIPALI